MVASVTVQEVIELVGSKRMGEAEIQKACSHFHLWIRPSSFVVENYGDKSLVGLMKSHPTMLLNVTDCRAWHDYAHAVILHKGMVYDPWAGINPMWPWSRVIWSARPISQSKHFNP
jgi:hypothetical protein